MTTRILPTAATALLTVFLLAGCSLLAPSAATVDADDLASAAEDWLEDDEDVKYKVECDDEEVTLEEDESIDCLATDRDTDLEYEVEITITDVDGEDFEVDVNRDDEATGNNDDDDEDADDSGDGDDVFSLVVGDCFNDATAEGAESVNTVYIVDCDEAHDREVYDQLLLEGDDDEYPGESSVTSDADSFCEETFEDFVGISYEESELYYVNFFPTEESWEEGDREILCLISEYDSNDDLVQVEGSLEGAER